MTHKVFWDDPYQVELESTVSRVDGPCIELEETIFYAESGGQESDAGTIGGIQVIKAEKLGLSIVYTLEHEPNFQAGTVVTTQIDWARRYALMKLHFAAEVILEVVTHRFPEMTKVGAHISADKSRIDFEWHESVKPLLPELQQQAQSVIDSHAGELAPGIRSPLTTMPAVWSQRACGGCCATWDLMPFACSMAAGRHGWNTAVRWSRPSNRCVARPNLPGSRGNTCW